MSGHGTFIGSQGRTGVGRSISHDGTRGRYGPRVRERESGE
jgi:hypothetical protein